MQITINKNYHNSRVDRFVREHFSIPQNLVAKLIREKKIKVNKKKVEISSHLVEGDIISVYYFLEKTKLRP
jgi:23S rRNA pseudouridine955/2504/2580 synthase